MEHSIDARYLFRYWKDGDQLKVIYETGSPDRADVYDFWGYWITWKELIASMALLVVLFQVAVAVTKNPTPESLMEQLEHQDEPKRKYKE
ncbi:MAG: hypothetical protein NVSMB63_05220 [Sediminibacterium sp.]